MAEQPAPQTSQDYVPDPQEIKRAYWIIFGIVLMVGTFVGALIETVIRHGNPFEVIFGGGSGGGH